MLCDECGAKLKEGSRFCGECGASMPLVEDPAARSVAHTQRGGTKATQTSARTHRGRRDGRPAPDPIKTTLAGVAAPEPPRPPSHHRDDDELTNPKMELPPREGPAPRPADLPLDPAVQRKAAQPKPSEAKPPEAKPAAPPSSPKDTKSDFQRLLDEVESGFEEILTGEPDPALAPTGETPFDDEQAKQLFRDLVVANARDIRDFMIELRLGEPSAAWVDYVRPSVRAIMRSAEGMGHGDLGTKLRRFATALDAAKDAAEPMVRGNLREALIDAYSELIVFFTEAFGLEAETNDRESVIVHALLRQVPELTDLERDRVLRAGLVSLGLVYAMRPADAAQIAGISLESATRLVERFLAYRKLASTLGPADARAHERRLLREAVEDLSRRNETYEAAEPGSAERRRARRARERQLAEIELWLGRLGRAQDARALTPLSYAARLMRLGVVMEDLERRAAGQTRGGGR